MSPVVLFQKERSQKAAGIHHSYSNSKFLIALFIIPILYSSAQFPLYLSLPKGSNLWFLQIISRKPKILQTIAIGLLLVLRSIIPSHSSIASAATCSCVSSTDKISLRTLAAGGSTKANKVTLVVVGDGLVMVVMGETQTGIVVGERRRWEVEAREAHGRWWQVAKRERGLERPVGGIGKRRRVGVEREGGWRRRGRTGS